MRALSRTIVLLAMTALSAPAFAQYYDYTPDTPSVDVNMGVLGEPELDGRPPALPAEPVTRVELSPPAKPQAPRVQLKAPGIKAVAAPVMPEPVKPAAPVVDQPKRLLKPFFTRHEPETPRPTEPKPARKLLGSAHPEHAKELADELEQEAAERQPAEPQAELPPAMPAPAVPSLADLTLDFNSNDSVVTPELEQKLDVIAKQLYDTEDTRLQVRAYAAGEDGNTSSARRISLSRALSVRSYLMDKGIKASRVDVRALGTQTDRSPLDRVDLVFVR